METLFTGQHLIRLSSVDSTNNYAASLLAATNVPEGTVILAYEQTAGRGQRGAQWHTAAGQNLTFSLVVFPRFLSVSEQFMLSSITALAVAHTLEDAGLKALVKWPNDVYSGRCKLAGILIENGVQGNRLSHSIIGVGINVNQLDFPEGIKAASLQSLTGRTFENEAVLRIFCRNFEKYYLLLRAGQKDSIRQEYLDRLLNYGVEAAYIYQDKPLYAVITGVSPEGRLLLRTREGQEISCAIREISWQL